jgi:cytochrome c2
MMRKSLSVKWSRLGRSPIAACTLIVAAALAVTAVVAQDRGSLELPGDPLVGRATFQSKSCAQCHHLVGSGPGIGPSLGAKTFRSTFLELEASL